MYIHVGGLKMSLTSDENDARLACAELAECSAAVGSTTHMHALRDMVGPLGNDEIGGLMFQVVQQLSHDFHEVWLLSRQPSAPIGTAWLLMAHDAKL